MTHVSEGGSYETLTSAQRRLLDDWVARYATVTGKTAGPAALYGGLATAAGVGIGLSLVRRSRAGLMGTMGGLGSDVGLTLAGIDVDVVSGAEHLWSARPCVFVFNHQSKLDPVLVMKLMFSWLTPEKSITPSEPRSRSMLKNWSSPLLCRWMGELLRRDVAECGWLLPAGVAPWDAEPRRSSFRRSSKKSHS